MPLDIWRRIVAKMAFDDICRSKRVCVSWNDALEGRIGWLLQVDRLRIEVLSESYLYGVMIYCRIWLENADIGRHTKVDDSYCFKSALVRNNESGLELQVVRFVRKLAAVLHNCGPAIRKLHIVVDVECWKEDDYVLRCCRKPVADAFARVTQQMATYQTLDQAIVDVHNEFGIGVTLLSWEDLLSCSKNFRVFSYEEGVRYIGLLNSSASHKLRAIHQIQLIHIHTISTQ